MICGKKVAMVLFNGRKYTVDFDELREMTDYYGNFKIDNNDVVTVIHNHRNYMVNSVDLHEIPVDLTFYKEDLDEDSAQLHRSQGAGLITPSPLRVRFASLADDRSGDKIVRFSSQSIHYPTDEVHPPGIKDAEYVGFGSNDSGDWFGQDNNDGNDLYDKDETSTAQPSTLGGGGDGRGGCAAARQQGYYPTLVGKRTGVTVSSQEQVTFDSPSSGKDVLFENHDAFSAAAEDEVSMPNVTSSNVVLPPFPCEIGKFWFILTYQYQR